MVVIAFHIKDKCQYANGPWERHKVHVLGWGLKGTLRCQK